MQLKRKLNSFYNNLKVKNFTNFDLARNLAAENIENSDIIKILLIDQQWTLTEYVCKIQSLTYLFFYFLPFYVSYFDRNGLLGKLAGKICWTSGIIFFLIALICIKQRIFTTTKFCDLIFFPLFFL